MYSIGIDEAGRGPWAGPVFASVVVLNNEQVDLLSKEGVTDSKKLSAKKREKLFDLIINNSIFHKVKYYSPQEIDQYGIYRATQELIKQLSADIPIELLIDQKVLIDGVFPGLKLLNSSGEVIIHECLIKGDAKVTSIASASILAKVRRDKFMEELDKKYPEYQFAKHKGYGTKLHMEMLEKYGPSDEHRKSFKPIAKFL